jgi:SNF2 family DNA or RNA helicase
MAALERLPWHVALIVAPLTSLGVTWRPKITLLPSTTVHRSPQDLRSALKIKDGSTPRHIVLTNPEGLRSALRWIAKLPWDIVIWDESQNIKNKDSRNSRIARKLRHVPQRIALSGTPIDTGQIDIWAQMRFVDHEVLGENWRDFANQYCYKSGWMGKEWVFSERKQEEFLDALKDHIFRLDDAFLGLTPINVVPVPTLILGEQRRIYDTMEAKNIVFLGEDSADQVYAHNAGARDVKLSQITGGAVLDAEGNVHVTGNAKRRKLAHLLHTLEDDDWPVVIFCQFLHEIDIIKDIVRGHKIAIIRGGIKENERTRIVSDFQKGKYDVLVCQIRTGGESIDLTRSSTIILYSMTYSYINFEQVLRRLQRGGQTRPVTAFIIFCVDTIDEEKLDLVYGKSENSFRILANFEE